MRTRAESRRVRPHDQAPEQGLGAGLERGLAVPPGHEELLYRLGVALLALDQPDRCLARGDTWIFGPESDYEREGDVGHVVFPCGYTIGDDGDALNLYYGAADTSVALATGSIRELLRGLKPPTVW